jgi:hypothetical protein
MFANTSWKRLLKVLSNVAEKIDVPERNAVPRMTAREVSTRRALRPRMLFSAIRNM